MSKRDEISKRMTELGEAFLQAMIDVAAKEAGEEPQTMRSWVKGDEEAFQSASASAMTAAAIQVLTDEVVALHERLDEQ